MRNLDHQESHRISAIVWGCFLIMALVIPSISVAQEASPPTCTPECSEGAKCIVLFGNSRCITAEEEKAIRGAITAPQKPESPCSPACQKDENCIPSVNGHMCVISPANCRPACASSQICVRGNYGYQCIGSEPVKQPAYSPPAPQNNYYYQEAGKDHMHKNYASAPAITLGVLSSLGGVIYLAAATGAPNDVRGTLVLMGSVNLGLGLWAIIAGAKSVEHH